MRQLPRWDLWDLSFDRIVQGGVRLANLGIAVTQTEPYAVADSNPVTVDAGDFLRAEAEEFDRIDAAAGISRGGESALVDQVRDAAIHNFGNGE
jgi:hypothetical protein